MRRTVQISGSTRNDVEPMAEIPNADPIRFDFMRVDACGPFLLSFVLRFEVNRANVE